MQLLEQESQSTWMNKGLIRGDFPVVSGPGAQERVHQCWVLAMEAHPLLVGVQPHEKPTLDLASVSPVLI